MKGFGQVLDFLSEMSRVSFSFARVQEWNLSLPGWKVLPAQCRLGEAQDSPSSRSKEAWGHRRAGWQKGALGSPM